MKKACLKHQGQAFFYEKLKLLRHTTQHALREKKGEYQQMNNGY